MTFKKKTDIITDSELSSEFADRMLQNVFDICEVESNTIPLETLVTYSNYRRERFVLQRVLLIIIMLLFCALPLLFIAPEFTVAEEPVRDYDPVYVVDGPDFFAIKNVTAVIDGYNMPVYTVDNGVYSIEPNLNGEMVVTLSFINGQYTQHSVQVTKVDRETPYLTGHEVMDGEQVWLYVADDGVGVDYESIYALDLEGSEIRPVSYDENAGCVVFAYPESSLNVYISDYSEHRLHLLLNP